MGSTKTVSIQELAPYIQETVSSGGSVELTVPGKSMTPTLIDRVSQVRLVELSTPKCGDMVLYRRDNGQFVIHRIVKCEGDDSYVLCGDAQYQLEVGIRRNQMIALVSAFTRRGEWISCTNAAYQCWWRICVFLRPWRHICAAVRRRAEKLIRRQ